MSAPVIISVGCGSLPTDSMVQVGYEFTYSSGATTVYSPTSSLVALSDKDSSISTYHNYKGASPVSDAN